MDYAEAQRNPGKHSVGLIVVIVLHVLLGWLLVSGLAKRIVDVAIKPVETKLIEEIKPPPPPPPENLPPPPKNMPPPPSFVPPPEVQVNPPPIPQPSITTTQDRPPPAPPSPVVQPTAPPAPPAPARSMATAARIDFGNCEKPEYPPKARQAEATGVTRIRFSIDEAGNVVKAEITGASGSTREHRMLDKQAVEALSVCRFKPGTDENGKPVGAFSNVEYVWKLDN